MVSGQVLVAVLVAALTWYLGSETVKGVKWIGHKVAAGVHKIVHPRAAPAPVPPADGK